MFTAFLGVGMALHLFTAQAAHAGYDVSLVQADIHPNVYVHIDWLANPQSPVSAVSS